MKGWITPNNKARFEELCKMSKQSNPLTLTGRDIQIAKLYGLNASMYNRYGLEYVGLARYYHHPTFKTMITKIQSEMNYSGFHHDTEKVGLTLVKEIDSTATATKNEAVFFYDGVSATPDGSFTSGDIKGIVELKSSSRGEATTKKVNDFKKQVKMGLFASGASIGWLIVYCLDGETLFYLTQRTPFVMI